MEASGSGPIALIAGSGRLPLLVADALQRAGRDHRILAFRGFAGPELRRKADSVIDLLDLRRGLAWLRDLRPEAVIPAGGVQRPAPSALLGAFAAFRNRREISDFVARGDDGLLRGVIALVEDQGHRVIGVHEIAPDLLAPLGQLGQSAPDGAEERSIEAGIALLESLSSHDVGQAAVVSGRRVLAVEGPEGTDRMMRRAGRLGAGWRVWRKPVGGVLVKAVKKGQDLRIDMPAIGPRTMVEAKRAGLRGVAVGAGSTLILDREKTVAAADRLGLFLVGIRLPWAA